MDKNYDKHGSAKHYDDQRINVIHQIEAIWGTLGAQLFCEINAFKYRARIGKKDDPSLELTKIKWYETMAKYLKEKDNKIKGLPYNTNVTLPVKFLKDLGDDK